MCYYVCVCVCVCVCVREGMMYRKRYLEEHVLSLDFIYLVIMACASYFFFSLIHAYTFTFKSHPHI